MSKSKDGLKGDEAQDISYFAGSKGKDANTLDIVITPCRPQIRRQVVDSPRTYLHPHKPRLLQGHLR